LQVENYEKGAKIFTRGQECEFIYFLIRGEIELVVDKNNQDHQLDVLSSGSFVGSYSIINETPFKFTGKAKSNLSLLLLSRENLFNLAE
jgi:CRP-like cAMP-binding protein